MKVRKINIDFKSFFKKKPKKLEDNFGVSFINGRMGSGKTYLATYLSYNYFSSNIKIKTNIHSLKIPYRTIEYFDTIDEIINDFEPNVLYVIDEISRKYTKESKQDRGFYSWLQQSRKRKRYVLLITQEYLQIPTWLRGVANYVYTTTKIRFTNLFKTYQGYPVLDEDTKEWNVQKVRTFIYKRNKLITDFYDTLETTNVL